MNHYNLNYNVSMDNYKEVGIIGKGSFGVVKKIQRQSDLRYLVSKEIVYVNMSNRDKQQLVAEVNILSDLKHPNIVKYEGRVKDSGKSTLHIIMEYCANGDLKQLLREARKGKNSHIPEDTIWKIFFQLILALDYCHYGNGRKVLHRDIKPANIFIDANNNIKLGDFGLSREMGEDSEFAQTYVGTPYYMSP